MKVSIQEKRFKSSKKLNMLDKYGRYLARSNEQLK